MDEKGTSPEVLQELYDLLEFLTADSVLSKEGARKLLQWLCDHPITDREDVIWLQSCLENYLRTGPISPTRLVDLYRGIENVLPTDQRQRAKLRRQAVGYKAPAQYPKQVTEPERAMPRKAEGPRPVMAVSCFARDTTLPDMHAAPLPVPGIRAVPLPVPKAASTTSAKKNSPSEARSLMSDLVEAFLVTFYPNWIIVGILSSYLRTDHLMGCFLLVSPVACTIYVLVKRRE
jgi:hypothetical protein